MGSGVLIFAMITSIVELPDFMSYGADSMSGCLTCLGHSEVHVDADGLYLPFDAIISEGRNIMAGTYRKYKMTVVPVESTGMRIPVYGRPWTVYIMTAGKLDLENWHLANEPIFPVYFRSPEGRVILNVQAINDMLSTGMVVTPDGSMDAGVMSTRKFINSLRLAAGQQTVAETQNPDIIDDWSYLSRRDPIVSIINTVGIENSDQVFGLHSYDVSKSYIPLVIQQIAQCGHPMDIAFLVNKEAVAVDEVGNAVLRSKVNWPAIRDKLRANNTILTECSDSIVPVLPGGVHLMGTFMDLLYATPGEDFWFDMKIDAQAVHDLYYKTVDVRKGFSTDTCRMRNGWDVVTYGAAAMNLVSKLPGASLLTAHRTCLDELVLYYKTDLENPVLWMDMVWWTLATAPGLINATNSAYFV